MTTLSGSIAWFDNETGIGMIQDNKTAELYVVQNIVANTNNQHIQTSQEFRFSIAEVHGIIQVITLSKIEGTK